MCNAVAVCSTTTLQYTATHCNILQHAATLSNALWQTAKRAPMCSSESAFASHGTVRYWITLQHTATHSSTLHDIALHCNTLQHCNTATHCKIQGPTQAGRVGFHRWYKEPAPPCAAACSWTDKRRCSTTPHNNQTTRIIHVWLLASPACACACGKGRAHSKEFNVKMMRPYNPGGGGQWRGCERGVWRNWMTRISLDWVAQCPPTQHRHHTATHGNHSSTQYHTI